MRNPRPTSPPPARGVVRGLIAIVVFGIVGPLAASPVSALDRPEDAAGVAVGVVLPRKGQTAGARTSPSGALLRLSVLDPSEICGLSADRGLPEPAADSRAILLVDPDAQKESCWMTGLVRLARSRSGRGTTYLIGDRPDLRMDATKFVFLLKRAAIALRAADSTAVVVAGPPRADHADWLASLAALGATPYVDSLACDPQGLAACLAGRAASFPGLSVWVIDRRPEDAPESAVLRAAALIRDGADVAVVRADTPEGIALLERLGAAIPRGARTPQSRTVRAITGGRDPALELLDADGNRLVLLAPNPEPSPLRVGLPPAESAELIDLSSGERRALRVRQSGGETRIRAQSSASPQLVLIHPVRDLTADRTEVERNRPGLTAEEIIARERESRARQSLRFDHFQARARMAYHFTISNLGESIDVVTENDAFGRGEAIEYRQTALFVNGHRWKGPPPAFPFVAPEKVKEIPLVVALHEGYHYELEAEVTEDGRPCYRISFEPTEQAEGDFRGTVWIDRDEFQRVRLDLVRLRPTQPVTSDVLTQWFAPVDTEQGELWLVERMDGQMVFSALARNAVVERKVDFEDFRINQPTFDAERQAALDSSDPMFRDSLAEGLVKLTPNDETGGRSAESATTESNTLLIAGWSASLDGDVGVPFAGINWFDLDYRGTGTQLDVAWAGPFAAVSATWPKSRSGWETSLQTFLTVLPYKQRYVDERGRIVGADVKSLEELIQASFRRTLTPYVTLSVDTRLGYLDVRRRSSTDKEYILPPSTLVPGVSLRLDVQRAGYQFGFWGETDRRLDWGPFGLSGDEISFHEVRNDPVRYGVQFNKNFYTRRMDRVSIDLDVSGGDNLDRFSAFGNRSLRSSRIRGFSSSGIRYKDGLVTELGYAVRAPGNLRIELSLAGGLFRFPEVFGSVWHYAYGAGLGVTFAGPRGTLIRVRTNYGIGSSLPIEGSQGSVRLTVYKTFSGWWPWKRHRGARRKSAPEDLPDQPLPSVSRILPATSSGEGTMPPAVP